MWSGPIVNYWRKFGHLDVLVNNAGAGHFKTLIEMDRAKFEAVFATNVTGRC
jgi:NAD(P)-dependent dehydrogenase (short-subunit alcohol dehydrogenase family)